jgi:hypothetical protein
VAKIGMMLVLAACSALATVNNCPSGTATATVSSGAGTNPNVPIMGAGGSPANDFASLGAPGCTNVDLNFNNFAGSFSGTGANGILTLAGTYFASTPSGTAYDPLTSPTSVLISSVRGAANVSTDEDNNDGNNNFISKTSSGSHHVNDSLAFVITDSNPTLLINSINVTVNFPVNQGVTGTITFNTCLGGTVTGIVTGAGSCTSGTFFATAMTLVTGNSQAFLITLPSAQSRIDFTSAIVLAGAGNNYVGFDSIGFSFQEAAPEPSTFVMLGSALIGLGVLGYRRRKSRSQSSRPS